MYFSWVIGLWLPTSCILALKHFKPSFCISKIMGLARACKILISSNAFVFSWFFFCPSRAVHGIVGQKTRRAPWQQSGLTSGLAKNYATGESSRKSDRKSDIQIWPSWFLFFFKLVHLNSLIFLFDIIFFLCCSISYMLINFSFVTIFFVFSPFSYLISFIYISLICS